MKFWKNLALSTAMLSSSAITQADTLAGIYASVDYWVVQGDYSYKEYYLDPNSHQLSSFNSEWDLDKTGVAQVALSIEHPVPFIPNVRFRYVGLDVDTEKALMDSRYGHYNLNLDSTDAIAYYEILDNLLSVDVGLAAKRLDGDITFLSTSNEKLIREVSETIPMLYGLVGGKLPFTGLSAKAEALLSVDSDLKVRDVSAELKYDFIDNILLDVGAKVGYRLLDMDLNTQKGMQNKYSFDGVYAGLELHF